MMNNVFWAIWFSFSTWILAEAIVCKCVRKRVAKILLLVHTQKIQLICELLLSGYCWNVKILDVIIKKPFVEKATEQLIERWRWSSLTRLWPRSASHSLFFLLRLVFFSLSDGLLQLSVVYDVPFFFKMAIFSTISSHTLEYVRFIRLFKLIFDFFLNVEMNWLTPLNWRQTGERKNCHEAIVHFTIEI